MKGVKPKIRTGLELHSNAGQCPVGLGGYGLTASNGAGTITAVSLRDRVVGGLRLLLDGSSIESQAELARRSGLSDATVSVILKKGKLSFESLESLLDAMGADFQDLAAAMAETSSNGTQAEVSEGAPPYGRPSPVSHLAELDYAPRPIDLFEDAQRILGEARRLREESPSAEAAAAVRAVGAAVVALGELFDHEDAKTHQQVLHPSEEPLSRAEFEKAMRQLKSMVERSIAEHEVRNADGAGEPAKGEESDG